MEESLLSKGIREDQRRSETPSLTWATFTVELKRLGFLAGPMVTVTLLQYLLHVISMMVVGDLGELALSSTAIAISLSGVTGFSFLVSLSCYPLNLFLFFLIFNLLPSFFFSLLFLRV
jgi:MATE family multidrug resistance protein